jgi:SnoaL-like domain
MADTLKLNPRPAWSASSGEIQLEPLATGLDATAAADRLLIAETAHLYAWAYDERQLAVLGAVFVDDAVWLGSVAANLEIGPLVGREAIVEWLAGHMAAQTDQRRHNALNLVIREQTETSATALSYLLLTKARDGVVSVTCTGVYRFSMVKDTGGVWRIKELSAGFDTPF